ncbi:MULTISPECIES: hypothetical protein [unclassified Coleofasciculus]|uniref:hypothetical protein n=1 Tax=unclassified Coleofasciculus TaxID=2692782 RepID=UPI0018811DCC|nr:MULTISPECIES: hypothetical protein [unclassified Coleofasciculus]MBE9124946.1 hypothetical protein [Coleofasciculus sp. LEGE 07081]MBE9147970.1 hypothetical protein [Coleofasciculus sp. LEGE 07092]
MRYFLNSVGGDERSLYPFTRNGKAVITTIQAVVTNVEAVATNTQAIIKNL